MSRKDRLSAFSKQIGFQVEENPDSDPSNVRTVQVPCLLLGGLLGTCTIETSYDPTTGKPDNRVGGDVHAVRVITDTEQDGLVYHADGGRIGNLVGGDGKTWSNISIKRGTRGRPEPDETAHDLLHRYAKHVIGAVAAAGHSEIVSRALPDPFHIPNTFEARAGIAPVQDHIRGDKVAIIGLGGTGSFLLDLIAKTPLSDIHLFDADCVEWHTLMRAPGVATAEEIARVRAGSLLKVDYYRSKYPTFRDGIHAHPVRVEDPGFFADFVAAHAIDFVFICIDQLTEGDSARQDVVYKAVSSAGVPFIDSGVSITIEDRSVRGAITTSTYEAGSDMWESAVPNARLHGEAPGYRNVQMPEVNAAAALFAVMEWRRRTGQYISDTPSFYQKFLLEKGLVIYPK